MAGTPAQVELVAPLMDQLDAAAQDDERAAGALIWRWITTELLPGAELANVNVPITPAQAQLLLRACQIWPGWTVAERGQMRGLLVELREAAQQDPPGWAEATPAR